MHWVAIAGVLGFALFLSTVSKAASYDFLALRKTLEMSGYASVPTTIPDLSVIQLQDVGPKAIDWIISEQKKGRDILVPVALAKGKQSDNKQILSVNPIWTEPALAGGLFVLLPRF